jgi:hypothetical protein
LKKIGIHLKSSRKIYSHHGIYIGNGKVIHYSGLAEGLSFGRIEITTLDEFSGTTGYEIVKHENMKYSSNEIVNRAKSRLGEDAYHLITNNCEHFVNWCIEGNHDSEQAFISKPFNKGKKKEIETSLKNRDRVVEFRETRLKDFF